MRSKSIPLLFLLLCLAAFAESDKRRVPKLRSMYIVGMAGGLDQYLANRLTSSGVAWIVLEPTRAEAILTDRVDEGFWAWLNSPHKPLSMPGSQDRFTRVGANPKQRGNIFLVDPKEKIILWSTYTGYADISPRRMDQAASRVAERLKDSFVK